MKKVIVAGGGAAGMMAALAAVEAGHTVILYEKNEKLGKKLFITGKGRCNVTNACETEELFHSVVSNPKFLYSAFYGFDNKAVMQLLEESGCPLKIERGERVFPVSDHSSDVIRALQGLLVKRGVNLVLNTALKEVLQENNQIRGVVVTQNGKTQKTACDAVIIATGGISYPLTGSTGDGYHIAASLGHQVTRLSPSLVPLSVKESCCADLQGLALKNVSAVIEVGKKEIYRGFGEMLFTHYGVSGPLILSGSSYLAKIGMSREAVLKLDLKPALNPQQLDKRLLRDFEENKKKQFKNAINGLFPSRLIPVMIEVSGIHPDKMVYDITKEERKQFVDRIKNWELHITGLRDYREAVITQGGVSVKEVNPSTMESKMVNGLYFAGEVLDVDALTGGFNLQIAWSTGHLAGSSIPEEIC